MQGGSSDGAGSGAQLLTRSACSDCAVHVQQVSHQLYILSVNSFLWLKSFIEGPGINSFCFPSCWTEAKQRLLKRHKWVQIFLFPYLQFSKHHGLKWHFASGQKKGNIVALQKIQNDQVVYSNPQKGQPRWLLTRKYAQLCKFSHHNCLFNYLNDRQLQSNVFKLERKHLLYLLDQ